MADRATIPVIDLFAGPGGLSEGFGAFEIGKHGAGRHPFRIGLSIEKDARARQTLRLRAFYRQFPRGDAPELYYDVLRGVVPLAALPDRLKTESSRVRQAWQAAEVETLQAELGASDELRSVVRERIRNALGDARRPWVLIGGPPCQAYSLAGRVRNRGIADYRIENDHRSTLYREYLRIIADHWPAVFVMENVKGLLSAKVDNQKVFDRIMADLESPATACGELTSAGPSQRYRIVPLVAPARQLLPGVYEPKDFIVAAEKYGVPQVRHRVILVGIREDLGDTGLRPLTPSKAPTVRETIGDLPRLRSGVSRSHNGIGYVRQKDSRSAWREAIMAQTRLDSAPGRRWLPSLRRNAPEVYGVLRATVDSLRLPKLDRGSGYLPDTQHPRLPESLNDWLIDERLGGVCNHETRGHLNSDLARYLFAACHAKVHCISPRLDEFPTELLPDHDNAASGHFNDRFRVQVADRPSTTITSHISKDGHYFIHYDPSQCRSLTVREAARLQTFPENYFFCGPRTSQYVQIGNAVPPFLARQIAERVWQLLVDSGRIEG